MSYYEGKSAIVTGGAAGIGRALAAELAARGATVHVADVDGERAAATARELGEPARAVAVDVTRAADVEELAADVARRHGRLDLMINNAGMGVLGEVRDLDLDHWRRVFDLNLWGTVHGVRGAYRVMLGQGSGQIVNVASVGGLVPLPAMTPYQASKFAVVALSLGLRTEAEALGVKVNVVCPGSVRTSIIDTSPVVRVDPECYFARVDKKLKVAEPGDVARRILRGVEKNRAVVLTDRTSRWLWLAYRLSPALVAPLGRAMLRDVRSCRNPEA